MFHVTRPQTTVFLVIIALMALLLLVLPGLSRAEPEPGVSPELTGKNLRALFSDGQKTPLALAGIKVEERFSSNPDEPHPHHRRDGEAWPLWGKPQPMNTSAQIAPAADLKETPAVATDIFFDLDREVTVDTELVKGSAGVQINW